MPASHSSAATASAARQHGAGPRRAANCGRQPARQQEQDDHAAANRCHHRGQRLRHPRPPASRNSTAVATAVTPVVTTSSRDSSQIAGSSVPAEQRQPDQRRDDQRADQSGDGSRRPQRPVEAAGCQQQQIHEQTEDRPGQRQPCRLPDRRAAHRQQHQQRQSARNCQSCLHHTPSTATHATLDP